MRTVLSICLLVTMYGCGQQKVLFETNPELLKPVSDIYKLGAHSTVRAQETVLTFYDRDHAEYKEHGVVTVLDEEHRNAGSFEMYYDQFRKLEYINVQVRNNAGIIVRNYTIKDANDYSASGSNFFSDVRVKVIEAHHYSYPYTVEYEYKYRYSGTLNLPPWYPKSFSQSIEKASFEIIDYTKGNLRYFSRNIEDAPVIQEYPEYTSTKWKLAMELASPREVYSPPYSEIFPNVLTSASSFKVGKSTGNASNWKLFGDWYYELSKGKRKLPAAAKSEIDRLISGIEDERERVKMLYKYMQDQVRYVSIQLGLGGWEPYPADFVYQNKYGDCKALVNFMHAILEYAGIEAQPALIRNGIQSPEVVADFPSNQFNHVVLRVTLENGEIMWLECTSKYIKPGRIGAGNEGKNALLVTSSGGEIIRTEVSEADENVAVRVTEVKLQAGGSAKLNSNLQNKGAMDDDLLHQLKPLSQKKREEWLVKSFSLNDFSLQSYQFFGLDEDHVETGYHTELEVRDFASATSKRLFVPVNKLNQWKVYIPDEEYRSTSLQLPYKFSEVDSTVFKLPEGYIIEALPESMQIENRFGKFSLAVSEGKGKVMMKRELVIGQQEIEKSEYENFKSFFTTVNKADQAQFVIVQE